MIVTSTLCCVQGVLHAPNLICYFTNIFSKNRAVVYAAIETENAIIVPLHAMLNLREVKPPFISHQTSAKERTSDRADASALRGKRRVKPRDDASGLE